MEDALPDRRADPSALRFLIGHDLRLARERAGIKQTDAAKVLGCSNAKINYLETGKTQQQPDETTILLRYYGADVAHVDRIASLAGQADQSTWWAPYGEVLPNWYRTYVGLEGLADRQFVYKSVLLDGQLQTPEYATALYQGSLEIPPVDVPQAVQARMARQRLTDDANPLEYRAVLEEYALDRVVGGPDVMRTQLEHLLELIQRPNVELRVMPLTVTVHDGINGEFALLEFAEAQSLGFVEYPTGAIYVQDQDQVSRYKMSSERLCAAALSIADSAEAIKTRIAKLAT